MKTAGPRSSKAMRVTPVDMDSARFAAADTTSVAPAWLDAIFGAAWLEACSGAPGVAALDNSAMCVLGRGVTVPGNEFDPISCGMMAM